MSSFAIVAIKFRFVFRFDRLSVYLLKNVVRATKIIIGRPTLVKDEAPGKVEKSFEIIFSNKE